MSAPASVDEPVAGFYAMRLRRGGLEVAVRIWFGLPIVDGEEQDRAPQWCCEIDGTADFVERDDATGYRCHVARSVWECWPFCAGHPISKTEYEFLLRRKAWAVEHAPEHPAANPRKRVDVRTMKPMF